MHEERTFVRNRGALAPGTFYMPRLGRHVLPHDVPVVLMRFAARFRTLFDADICEPKRLDIEPQFGALANNLHILARELETDAWRFARFAPEYARRLGVDLTEADICDARYAPYGTRLDDKMRQLVQRQSPFYAMTHIGGIQGDELMHRLFIPMSNTGQRITHSLVCLA